ncbi:maltokinase N-terminal cap-like domain-containing protein [Gordonia sp. (in: high G+C Gram-positive bacteria)]|uniref:maltokinase N-terminal cap-like domain-containing protein n=1 Tax=Gordonia sp. (in: high G+C Gram-positive bacteria) TaxID=84139 RepID=UPI003F985DAB
MAVIYDATLSPSKEELIRDFLDSAGLARGDVERLAAYRFDDPEGEVGIEAHIVARGGRIFHVPLTYRGAPLDGATPVGTMEHSVLGRRWVYAAADDPVALDAYTRALHNAQGQAALEAHRADGTVEPMATTMALIVVGEAELESTLHLTYDVGTPATGHTTLVATWADESVVVAALD